MCPRIFSAAMAVTTCWSMLLYPLAARPASPGEDSQAPGTLQVEVVGGSGAINNLKSRTAREVVVEVHDENHKPVAGAMVTFRLPYEGAGGNNLNGGKIIESITDAKGQAIGRFQPSGPGEFKIDITAASQGRTGTKVIAQTNVARVPVHVLGMSGKALAILASVAAAGTAAAVVSTRGGRGTTISSGTPTVGAPQP